MTKFRNDEILDHMKAAAKVGGASLARNFERLKSLEILEKGPSDFVSAADIEAETAVVSYLQERLLGIAIVGEEGGRSGAQDGSLTIVVDPLDGTNNFLHGIPHFSVSLALMQEGEAIVGVTYNPMNGDLFWALKDGGAFLGDTRLSGSPRTTLPKAVVGTCFPYNGKGDHQKCAREMAVLMPEVSGIRSPGSAALEIAYVAEGRFDGFWTSGAKLELWDLAAGVIIAREAGCLATEITGDGDPYACRSLLVAPPQFHGSFVDILKRA